MLNRCKVLIELLRTADRPVEKIELMKWAFVLRNETSSRGGPSFYEFVPYRFGPFSFSLDREIDGMAATGHVLECEKSWNCGDISVPGGALATGIAQDIVEVVGRLRGWTTDALLDHVYRTYPAFTVNSRRERLRSRPEAPPAVYTAGYEGLQVDGFLNLLVTSGIRRLVDVRRNPIARRFGFHKSTLKRLCECLDIEYVHVPELGIASERRRALASAADYLRLFDEYEGDTLATEQTAVDRVAESVVEKPSVLVCMEADPCYCHRSRLADDVARRTGLPIVHLKAEP